MKPIKITSILLCIILLISVFAGCNAPDGNKTDVSKNDTGENASVIPEEVSPQESETAEKIEPWGTDYDWDFLKGWQQHSDNYGTEIGYSPVDRLHYNALCLSVFAGHSEFETLIHVRMLAYYADEYDPSSDSKEDKYNFADEAEISKWLKAGNIPLEIETFKIDHIEGIDSLNAFCGYLSGADVDKLVEYGTEAGYYLHFEIPINYSSEVVEGMFVCPHCNSTESN